MFFCNFINKLSNSIKTINIKNFSITYKISISQTLNVILYIGKKFLYILERISTLHYNVSLYLQNNNFAFLIMYIHNTNV